MTWFIHGTQRWIKYFDENMKPIIITFLLANAIAGNTHAASLKQGYLGQEPNVYVVAIVAPDDGGILKKPQIDLGLNTGDGKLFSLLWSYSLRRCCLNSFAPPGILRQQAISFNINSPPSISRSVQHIFNHGPETHSRCGLQAGCALGRRMDTARWGMPYLWSWPLARAGRFY